jgi:endonuclease YncB( thermonuclease family)
MQKNRYRLSQLLLVIILFLFYGCSASPSKSTVEELIVKHFQSGGYTVDRLEIGDFRSMPVGEKQYMGTQAYDVHVPFITLVQHGRAGVSQTDTPGQQVTFENVTVRIKQKTLRDREWMIDRVQGIDASSFSPPPPLKGEAIRITDGDTVVLALERDNEKMTCRLYGIDSPERAWRDRPGQPYAKEAGSELEKLIAGKTVTLITTGERTHGREVCFIRKNGVDINLEMVQRGYAWAYRKHLRSPHASEYIEAEKKARDQGLGLWQQKKPLAPWEFKRKYWNQ